ncbi:hypothetical protein BT63DRAFT_17636 [Microthyrium microscopicum]|uniref:CBM21 domain-containing protein n=1 Tax=Microthyrium microscopicum TaxID=703497 RepID=A0A6A6USF5_9PEZI|nr:hypothetical protein BT63DRAFT_17636 [Microthyrium microscopicum]
MPYTPPTPRSPATSSPSITRNHSYDKSSSPSTKPVRQELPRSKSATYLHKHRRGPSFADQQPVVQASNTHGNPSMPSFSDGNSTVIAGRPSLPITSFKPLLSTGLTASPIEAGSSEDDEDRGRSRQIAVLAQTLKSSGNLSMQRRQSPTRREDGNVPLAPKQTPLGLYIETATPPPLSQEQRKISHSRSSSDMLYPPQDQMAIASDNSSPIDSDDEAALERRRVQLIRKKSGELVRPALRDSSHKRRPLSAPGTPTYPKAVHFNENIEQVRHFLQVDKPSAVSADSSPVETYDSESDYPFGLEMPRKSRPIEWEIKTNFDSKDARNSHERQCMPVRVEQLTLSKDFKSLEGICAVANIAFEKFIVARFTFDYWRTTSEVIAEWTDIRFTQHHDGYDRFKFTIKLSEQANLQNKTLYLCVRYNSGGQEHWDNNGGANFQIDFSRKLPAPKMPAPRVSKTVGSTPLSTPPVGIPRSRHSSKNTIPRPRSFPMGSSDDEFSTQFESPFRGRTGADRKKGHTFQDHSLQHSSSNRLSTRYDFNSSLHAALTTAQNALGDLSGISITPKQTPPPRPQRVVAPVAAPVVAPVAPPAPAVQPVAAAIGGARPTLGSEEYRDLIQKFCYFGSDGNNTAVTSPTPKEEGAKQLTMQQIDGALDDSSDSNTSSAGSSASNSPPSPKVKLHPQPVHTPEPRPTNRTPSPGLKAINSPRLNPFRAPSPALSHSSAYEEFPHQGLSVQSALC